MVNSYLLLTKPGIIMGNVLTALAGFFLASQTVSFTLLAWMLLGLISIVASGCVFNNFLDRELDQKMERTKNRALAKGLISAKKALLWGGLLWFLANLAFYQTNDLTLAIANFGFFIYVCPYTLLKTRSTYATAIGSLAGATPPVIGYTTVSQNLDGGALILFFMLVLWQMPHFYAIAIMHLRDYEKANLAILPVKKGLLCTQIHMLVYILLFAGVASLLTFMGYTGYFYFYSILSLSLIWFIVALNGSGKTIFRYSLALIFILCLLIPLDKI